MELFKVPNIYANAADCPTNVVLFVPTNGNVISTNELQSLNAPLPIVSTEFGTSIIIILVLFMKDWDLISVTRFPPIWLGIIKLVPVNIEPEIVILLSDVV